jgi:hypothetical protein
MWKPKDETANWEPIPGIGGEWRELTDEEFAQLDEQLGGGLDRWYERDDVKTKKKAPASPAAEGN